MQRGNQIQLQEQLRVPPVLGNLSGLRLIPSCQRHYPGAEAELILPLGSDEHDIRTRTHYGAAGGCLEAAPVRCCHDVVADAVELRTLDRLEHRDLLGHAGLCLCEVECLIHVDPAAGHDVAERQQELGFRELEMSTVGDHATQEHQAHVACNLDPRGVEEVLDDLATGCPPLIAVEVAYVVPLAGYAVVVYDDGIIRDRLIHLQLLGG